MRAVLAFVLRAALVAAVLPFGLSSAQNNPKPPPSGNASPHTMQLPPGRAGDRLIGSPELPPGVLPLDAAGNDGAQDRLVDEAIPVEDQVLRILERIEDDAEADLDDLIDEMARNRDERSMRRAERERRWKEAEELRKRHQQELREKRKALREAARDARRDARDAREERREQLRRARAEERHQRWVAREKARMARDARRHQRQEAREQEREARREAREQRRRKSHLIASLVSALVDQFNAPDAPSPARVDAIQLQIDQQVGFITPPPGDAGDRESAKGGGDAATLRQGLASLRKAWQDYLRSQDPAGEKCTKCD